LKRVVYIETSVISYLTSRPSRDVVIAGRQAISQDWWQYERQRFELRSSALVEAVPVTVYSIGSAMNKSLTYVSKASARHRRRANSQDHQWRAPL